MLEDFLCGVSFRNFKIEPCAELAFEAVDFLAFSAYGCLPLLFFLEPSGVDP